MELVVVELVVVEQGPGAVSGQVLTTGAMPGTMAGLWTRTNIGGRTLGERMGAEERKRGWEKRENREQIRRQH